MPNRREFLATSGGSLVALAACGGRASAAFDGTWLTYAPDVEAFWRSLPFLDRLRKVAEASFTRYEFGRWKAKDTDAIAKLDEELGIQAAYFTGYAGLAGPRWKDGLLDTIEDAVALAAKLGAARVGIIAGDRDEKIDREEQVDDLVDSLKTALEKVAESEVVLVLEPGVATSRGKPLLATTDEAVEVARAVGSDRVKVAFTVRRAEVDAGKVPGQIKKHAARVGAYRLAEFALPAGSEVHYARILRAIHDVGHADPIGVGLLPRADPSATIEALRKADAAAKAL